MKDLYLLPWLEETDVTTWPFVFSTIAITIVVYTLVYTKALTPKTCKQLYLKMVVQLGKMLNIYTAACEQHQSVACTCLQALSSHIIYY